MIVEAAVPGREIECGVLAGRDGGLPEASLPAEIRLRPGTDWYDFAAKYLDDAVDFDVPADLTPEQTAGGAGGRPPRLPGDGLPRAWPGSTSSSGRRPTAATAW